MSVPADLRALCHLLSTTETPHLPSITPTLQRLALGCGSILSTQDGSSMKSDTNESSVLVHKLKTQISVLLNGRIPEGRFAAVVLIQAVVDVGGWEVLRSSESWVRGLLSLLNKPQDPVATKRLCILTLTTIYTYTHQYQTLIREITTPTLPTFVTSCLNVIAPKSAPSIKIIESQASVVEVILECLSGLVPRHPAIFRPFNAQIRAAILPYLAPTISDEALVPVSVQKCARRLSVVMYQTAPKNTSGEEWAKGMRKLIKDIHGTADIAFRAAIEDWESNSGYIAEPVDVNADLQGGAGSATDMPRWEGITAGVERLTGQLYLLEQFFTSPTSAAVAVPMGSILDLITRMLSIAGPSAESSDGYAGARTNPAIDREEREGLWASLSQVHIASMHVLSTIVDRLQAAFSSMSQNTIDQLTWLFPSGCVRAEFRAAAYRLLARLLPLGGSMMLKASVTRLTPLIRNVCKDLRPFDPTIIESQANNSSAVSGQKKIKSNGASANADTFLQNPSFLPEELRSPTAGLAEAANQILPLLLSHLPQEHLEISIRADIDRTAIITQHKEAMLTSILNPFTGKGGKRLTSILPHLCRNYSSDTAVESFLRPRMPPLPAIESEDSFSEDVMMEDPSYTNKTQINATTPDFDSSSSVLGREKAHESNPDPAPVPEDQINTTGINTTWMTTSSVKSPKDVANPSQAPNVKRISYTSPARSVSPPTKRVRIETATIEEEGDSDSDGSEIAHLEMELDSDSDPDA